ncbi:MAG: bifunctional 2-methylcitrate dehydratase/aconitate hydratase [Gammaproteobacteria bacterium]
MDNTRPAFDEELQAIADYVLNEPIESELAFETARLCLMDSIGCAVLALSFKECVNRLGPWVEGATLKNGARVIGTRFELDPIKAAFDNAALIRWLDFNDTWLAQEWGHPSDNLGALLSVTDYLSRQDQHNNITCRELCDAMIRAHEIQGILALENSFNRVGLDHVILVKVASAALATKLMGGNRDQILNALSLAWVDGQSLRTYRHAPNTGPRKSWAAGDATSRGVRLALMAMKGEPGYPSALSAKTWGFCDVSLKGQPIKRSRPYGTYVMENVLFKIAFPAEFHGQTAVEAALTLHRALKDRLDEIEIIEIDTQEAGMRIINKTGPLHNEADRDHSLQYMVAYSLIHGELTSESYTDESAKDPRIDVLRSKMQLREDPEFTKEYFDPEKRAIPNRVVIRFKNGSALDPICVRYPLGHRRRREEGIPKLYEKFSSSIASIFSENICKDLQSHFDPNFFWEWPVKDLMEILSSHSIYTLHS